MSEGDAPQIARGDTPVKLVSAKTVRHALPSYPRMTAGKAAVAENVTLAGMYSLTVAVAVWVPTFLPRVQRADASPSASVAEVWSSAPPLVQSMAAPDIGMP